MCANSMPPHAIGLYKLPYWHCKRSAITVGQIFYTLFFRSQCLQWFIFFCLTVIFRNPQDGGYTSDGCIPWINKKRWWKNIWGAVFYPNLLLPIRTPTRTFWVGCCMTSPPPLSPCNWHNKKPAHCAATTFFGFIRGISVAVQSLVLSL